MTTGDLWSIHEKEIITQLHARGIEVLGATTLHGVPKSLISQVGLPLAMLALISSWIAFQIYYRGKKTTTPPPASSKPQATITLFKFDVPEIAHLPLPEQEKLLSTTMTNPAVQAAYTRYWQRPAQWALAPVVIIALVGAVKNWNQWWTTGTCTAITIILFPIIRPFYKRQLIEATRAHLLAEASNQSSGPDATSITSR